MKKALLLVGGVILGLSMQAQTLPSPVYTLDFEGAESVADFDGVQIGDGALLKSNNPNFGTYYQNAPEKAVATKATNYLRVNTNALQQAANKTKNGIAITFWVNPTVANMTFSDINYYYSVLFGFYSAEKDSYNSTSDWNWPMFTVNTRLWMQINSAGAWDDFGDGENAAGTNKIDTGWLAQKTTDEAAKDSLGNDTIIKVPTGFDDNWHFVALSFDPEKNTTTLFIDGALANLWTNKAGFYETENFIGQLKEGKYDRLYIGGVAQWTWADPDPAFAYDDFSVYASELTQDQIELLIDIKNGTLSEADRIIVARGQLEAAKNNLENYVLDQGAAFEKLADDVSDWLFDEIGEPIDYKTVEDVNAAIAKIQEKENEVLEVVNAYEAFQAKADYYGDLVTNTDYAGSADFKKALADAQAALAAPTTTEEIAAALATLEAAKVTYLFSQTGDEIDVTRVINKPWFVNEAYEPTKEADGKYTFPEGAANNLSREGWTLSASENLSGQVDVTLYLTNGRTTANLFHSSTAVGGVLDVQQTISGLPVGYYAVSADLSSTSEKTDNHVYATSGGVTKVSGTPTDNATYLWNDDHTWETLTTDKVYVGEDGQLVIGAAATTDGTAYKGWFCVTNFQLTYYGKEVDLSKDVQTKAEEVTAAIAKLTLKGDAKAATEKLETIQKSDATDYGKVSSLTTLLEEVNETAAKEQAFSALKDIEALASGTDDATVKAVYTNGAKDIEAATKADDATVETLDELTKLYAAYGAYAPVVKAAQAWGTEAVSSLVGTQVAALSGATVETLADNQAALLAAMKASIPDLTASEAEPKDITALVGNASFDGDLKDAWTVTIDGGTTNVSQAEVEFYDNTKFNISQVITDLPKGTYKLAASGFYRDGNNYADIVNNYWTKQSGDSTVYDTHANVTLYAASETFNRGTKLVSIASDSLLYGAEDDDAYQDYYGTTLHVIGDFTANGSSDSLAVAYYPYWMSNAYKMITLEGKYAGNEVDFVVSAEKQNVTIGAVKTGHIGGDWTILDNFRLYYLGQEIPVAIEQVPEAGKAAAGTKANGKYLEKGRIVIVKNGVKYNVSGQVVK